MMSNLYCATNLLMGAQRSRKIIYIQALMEFMVLKLNERKDLWKSSPSEHDKYAGWAKRIGELQIEAYKRI